MQPSSLDLIAAERLRQQSEEGYTKEHDFEHPKGELAEAAACYATRRHSYDVAMGLQAPWTWPFAKEYWKPVDRVRNLVKAGALICAEIERLQHAADQGV
jgi:hypothetical protein